MNPKIEQRFVNVSNSRTFKNIVDTLSLGKKAVLDLGCSYGEFLAHFGEGSVGVTIVEEESAYGKARGLDVRYGNVESENFELKEKFDAIFANNLFEHLYSPHAFLINIKNFLKPGGVLILGVPCMPKLGFLIRFKKFRGSLASAHINFFVRDTLAKTVESAGWKIEAVRGFRIKTKALDRLLDLIYPHFYVVAKVNPEFNYSEKRMKELAGYDKKQ